MHAFKPTPRFAIAPLLAGLLLALAACGGGGGGAGSSSGTTPTGATLGAGPAGGATGTTAGTTGSPGDDTYTVTDPDTVIVELPNGGTDTVWTSVSYQLPPNVENLYALEPSNATVLTGNDLGNRITGNPFRDEEIFGLGGDDVLDGGGRIGGTLDGGEGNDRLIVSFGTLRGGPGADTFVAGGRGAMTAPDTPITVADFNAAEGDRLEIVASQAYSAADLWASGALTFDAATGRLVFAPGSVEQVFILQGVTTFDPAWVTFTVR